MDTDVLVNDQIHDGRLLLNNLVRTGFAVTVAFWVKPRDEDLWLLHIASPLTDTNSLPSHYQAVYASLRRITNPSISLHQTRLIDASSELAKEAIAIRDRNLSRSVTEFHGKWLGNLAIDEAYIYPLSVASMTPIEVMRSIVELMNRAGTFQPITVELRDGSSILCYPTGIEMRSGDAYVKYRVHPSGLESAIRADDIQTIL